MIQIVGILKKTSYNYFEKRCFYQQLNPNRLEKGCSPYWRYLASNRTSELRLQKLRYEILAVVGSYVEQ